MSEAETVWPQGNELVRCGFTVRFAAHICQVKNGFLMCVYDFQGMTRAELLKCLAKYVSSCMKSAEGTVVKIRFQNNKDIC